MKARVKFSKTGSMRFIGHLDIMRYFQKAFRRAGIGVALSQGFSPHPLMSFASPLGIGLSSDGEYLDIVLQDDEPLEGILERMNGQMNEEIQVKSFVVLEEEAKTSMAVLAACDYLIAVKPDRDRFLLDEVRRREALSRFRGREHIEILKKTKRSEKLVDIRENIYCITDDGEEFRRITGGFSGDYPIALGEEFKPVLYCELTAGSVTNIKPELVLEALCHQEGEEYDWLVYQIHRLEMYADVDGVKGEVHTLVSEKPCRLVPLEEFEVQEAGRWKISY